MNPTRHMDAYPLSYMQQGMLFHSVSAPASDLYVEQLSCRLGGDLDLVAFGSAWAEVLGRHAVLRTAFAWKGLPEPLQVVGPRVSVPLEQLDWRGLDGAAQEERLRALRAAERLEGFDLARAPLMRIKLVRLADATHHLVWTWHHIILDAWSVPVVFEELFATYDARVGGREPALKPTRPYKDFIAWQRSQDLSRAEEFWRDLLGSFREPTPFGVEGLGGAGGGAGYGLEFLEVPPHEVEALRDAARRMRVTLNTLAQGAWALLLGRYAGRDDVLFGTAVAGRPPELPGVETMVGLLINTLPSRVSVDPRASLGEWLAGLQRRQTEQRRYEYTPLSQLQGWSSVPRGTQLFESLLVFENFPLDMRRLRGGGLEIADIDFVERANFPLTVMMSVRDESKLGAGYDRARFDDDSVRRMLGHLRTLLAEMARDPGRRLRDLQLMAPRELRQLVEEFGRAPRASSEAVVKGPSGEGGRPPTDGGRAAGLPITRLFEAQAESAPDATAATFVGGGGEISLSYREMNARANALARRLRALGVARGERVALCMEPSLARLAAVIAVLKAGGAYVPLDPASPRALLLSFIRDSGARVLLADAAVAPGLRDCGAQHTLLLDDALEPEASDSTGATPGVDSENLTDGPAPEDLAYIIYTSGSTGRPKGVAVPHASLLHLVEAQVESFRIGPRSRVLQFASLSFDASVSEIFTALAAGASLVMAPRKVLTPSRDLLFLLERAGVTTVTFPPSVLSALPSAELPTLRTLVSAGEPCPRELAERWSRGRLFLNAYGPTECTVCATVGEVSGGAGKPSIGRPIGAARVYILGPDLRPVPVGVAGDLYVGGPGVAYGYWNRPELTGAGFLPDPFTDKPGARMYRTGDLARFLPDGEVDFLGRLDDQVKVRGFRVELSEVEAALRSEGPFKDVAVIAAGDSAEGRRLVAYVVTEQDGGDVCPAQAPEWWPSIAEFLVYDELAYHAMTSDERRNESYRAAIREKVRGRVVLEVGTGPEALLARFCAEAGARKVYAVEMLADTFDKARARVAGLGLEGRIEVVHGDATTVLLPEPAEVCVSEIVGSIGGSEGAAVILNGVRPLLGAAAEMIPARSKTMYAPVELPDGLLDNLGFGPLPARYVGKIFEEMGRPFDLRLCVRGLGRSHLLAAPRVFEDLDFSSTVNPEGLHRASHLFERGGRFDGFLVWLTLDTGAGEQIDILEHEHCWLPVFFPVLDTRVEVSAGDSVEAVCGSVLSDDGRHPDYFVEGTLFRGGREPLRFRHDSPHHPRAFRASPFYSRFFRDAAVPLLGSEPRARAAAGFDLTALRRGLRERLPEYMIPSEFVRLDRMPLTVSGKLDRRALLTLGGGKSSTLGEKTAPPRSEAERIVADIWRRLLRLDEVGLQTNFFDQGGHSLLLLKVQDEIKAEAGVDILVTDLFKYPTVETLAQRLTQEQESARRKAAGEDGGAGASVRREILTAKAEAKAKAKAYAKQTKAKIKEQLKEKAKAALKKLGPPAGAEAEE